MGIKMKLRGLFASALLALSVAVPTQSHAITNAIYLALDGSGSIAAADWTLQVNGTVGALNTVFGTGNYWGTAIGVSQFSNGVTEIAAMTIINDNADLLALTGLISGTAQFGGQTALGAAIDAAAAAILDFEVANGQVTNKVIDVSTDGFDTVGGDPIASANAAFGNNITTNCLGIENFGQNAPDCTFATGFSKFADSFAEYEDALTDKLVLELTAPEPGITALLGMGLLGIGFARRKRTA